MAITFNQKIGLLGVIITGAGFITTLARGPEHLNLNPPSPPVVIIVPTAPDPVPLDPEPPPRPHRKPRVRHYRLAIKGNSCVAGASNATDEDQLPCVYFPPQ
jgi:hypothetical protein